MDEDKRVSVNAEEHYEYVDMDMLFKSDGEDSGAMKKNHLSAMYISRNPSNDPNIGRSYLTSSDIDQDK